MRFWNPIPWNFLGQKIALKGDEEVQKNSGLKLNPVFSVAIKSLSIMLISLDSAFHDFQGILLVRMIQANRGGGGGGQLALILGRYVPRQNQKVDP